MNAVRIRECLSWLPDSDGGVWSFTGSSTPTRVHCHDELEINLVTSGRARYLVNERFYDLAKGTSIWLFPGQEHVLLDANSDFTMWIAVFRPELLKRLCSKGADPELMSHLPLGVFAKTLESASLKKLVALCEDLADTELSLSTRNAGLAWLVQCAWQLHQHAGQITPRSDVHPAVERVVRRLREQDEPVSVKQLAAEASLSESQLARVFKQQLGMTLVHYRMLRRLERFRELFGQGHRRNLTEAALDAGFGSYSHFYRAFKQVYGYAPREYQRRTAELSYSDRPHQ